MEPNLQFYIRDNTQLPQINFNYPLTDFGLRNLQDFIIGNISTIQANVNKNLIRNFAFNVISENYYNNPIFYDILTLSIEYAEALMAFRGLSENQALEASIKEVVDVTSFNLVLSNPDIVNQLGFYEKNQLEAGKRKATEIQNIITQYKGNTMNRNQQFPQQPMQQQFPQQQFPQQPMQQQYPQQGPMPLQPQQQFPQQPMQQQFPQQQFPQQQPPQQMGAPNGVFNNPNQMPNAQYNNRRRGKDYSRRANVSMSDYETNPTQAYQKDFRMTQTAPMQPQENQVQNQFVNNTPNPNNAINSDKQCIVVNGVELFSVSEAKRLSGKYKLKIPVYNPDQQVLVSHFDDKENEYVVIALHKDDLVKNGGNLMDFEEHELSKQLRGYTPPNKDNGRVIPLTEPLYTQELKTKINQEKGIDYSKNIKVINTSIVACDDNYARLAVEKLINNNNKSDNGKTDFTKTVLEYGYFKVTPIIINTNPEVVDEFYERIENVDTVHDFIKQLNTMIKLDLDKRFISLVIERSTNAINVVLSKRMSTYIKIDNIIEDWFELKDSFLTSGNYAKEEGEGLFNILNNSIEMVLESIKLLQGEPKQKFLEKEELNKDIYVDRLDNLFLLVDKHYTSMVPWSSKDLQISVDEKGSDVRESIYPELYNAIKGIIQRANKIMDNPTITINLSDGVKLNLTSGIYNSGYLVISKE